jgi:hypothetical protein
MTPFLVLLGTIVLMNGSCSSAKFQPVLAFYNKIESKSLCCRKPFSVISSSYENQQTKTIFVRGGAKDENGDDDDDAGEENCEDIGSEDDEQYEETSDENESDGDSSDEDDYYDDETDEEEETELASRSVKKPSTIGNKGKSSESFVEPYYISPSLQMYTTFGTILLSRKVDMFNRKVVRLIRLLFVVYLIVQQAFIFYVRIMAKRNNDRTPVHVQNPITSMLSSQLEKQPAGANDMVKNLASSFLKTESTVVEYDMGQARNMQGGVLFNMAFMWFLHFKLQQVQPLLVTTVNGILQIAYNPLFQVYIMGRNLQRPFKSPEVFKDPRAQEHDETTAQDGANEAGTGDSQGDEVGKAVEEESSNDEDDDSSDDIDVEDDEEEVENSSDEEDDSE